MHWLLLQLTVVCGFSVGWFTQIDFLSLICRNLQYIEADGAEHFHTLKGYPGNLEKKVTLLKYFLSYMNDHLLKVK